MVERKCAPVQPWCSLAEPEVASKSARRRARLRRTAVLKSKELTSGLLQIISARYENGNHCWESPAPDWHEQYIFPTSDSFGPADATDPPQACTPSGEVLAPVQPVPQISEVGHAEVDFVLRALGTTSTAGTMELQVGPPDTTIKEGNKQDLDVVQDEEEDPCNIRFFDDLQKVIDSVWFVEEVFHCLVNDRCTSSYADSVTNESDNWGGIPEVAVHDAAERTENVSALDASADPSYDDTVELIMHHLHNNAVELARMTADLRTIQGNRAASLTNELQQSFALASKIQIELNQAKESLIAKELSVTLVKIKDIEHGFDELQQWISALHRHSSHA